MIKCIGISRNENRLKYVEKLIGNGCGVLIIYKM